jgi:hypothetical protein
MVKLGFRAALVAIACVALAGGLIVGVNDNLPGIALLFGGLICLVLAVVYRWRRPKSFLLLFALSALGFVVFAILHNVFYAIGESVDIAWVQALMEALSVGAFLIAILLCPAGILVGLVGWIAVLNRTRKESDPATG